MSDLFEIILDELRKERLFSASYAADSRIYAKFGNALKSDESHRDSLRHAERVIALENALLRAGLCYAEIAESTKLPD